MSTSHRLPVNQSPVILHQATVSFTRHRSTRHWATYPLSTRYWSPVNQSPVNQAMYCLAINHRSTGHRSPRHQVTSHRSSDTKYRLLGTSHWSSSHWLLYKITMQWTPVSRQPGTSHWAPGTGQFTRHQSSDSKDWFEFWVANCFKGILCNHYRMKIRILDIPNYY